MKIGSKILLFYFCLIVLLSLLVGVLFFVLENSKQLAELQVERYEFRRLADELSHNSDELTRMARTFVITGDERFLGYYDVISALRDGGQPGSEIKRDVLSKMLEEDHSLPEINGENISIMERIRALNLTAQELELLEQAKSRSDQLMGVESEAFHALHGEYKDDAGAYVREGPVNVAFAVDLLFGEDYHREKARIRNKLDDFFQLLEERTLQQVNAKQTRQQWLFMLLFVLGSVLLMVSLFGYVYFNRAIVAPLHDIQKWINQIDNGDYEITASFKQNDEIGRLANTFITMSKKISRTIAKLEQVSRTDPLTRARNRIALDEELVKQKYNYERYGIPFSVIMFDLDRFKEVNDRHGHLAGDAVLKELVELVRNNIRNSDVLGRWGGEEFLIVCPLTRLEEARILADSLRINISDHVFTAIEHRTASFGVAEFDENSSIEVMIDRADRGLYQAKANGRNQVCY